MKGKNQASALGRARQEIADLVAAHRNKDEVLRREHAEQIARLRSELNAVRSDLASRVADLAAERVEQLRVENRAEIERLHGARSLASDLLLALDAAGYLSSMPEDEFGALCNELGIRNSNILKLSPVNRSERRWRGGRKVSDPQGKRVPVWQERLAARGTSVSGDTLRVVLGRPDVSSHEFSTEVGE